MKILHLGDLHFKKKSKYDQNRIIESLLLALEDQQDLNFLFFSGDLINNGANKSDFADADEFLFVPVLNKTNLSRENLFICAGNHDIDRTVIINSIISNFSEKKNLDRKTLEHWFSKHPADKKASLQSNQNFFDYLKNAFKY